MTLVPDGQRWLSVRERQWRRRLIKRLASDTALEPFVRRDNSGILGIRRLRRGRLSVNQASPCLLVDRLVLFVFLVFLVCVGPLALVSRGKRSPDSNDQMMGPDRWSENRGHAALVTRWFVKLRAEVAHLLVDRAVGCSRACDARIAIGGLRSAAIVDKCTGLPASS